MHLAHRRLSVVPLPPLALSLFLCILAQPLPQYTWIFAIAVIVGFAESYGELMAFEMGDALSAGARCSPFPLPAYLVHTDVR